MLQSFLFELGTEELPDSFLAPALKYMQESLEKLLKESGLTRESISLFGTPRRLAILATGIPKKQDDIQVEKTGPSKNIAFDSEGNLSKAGLGFLRKSGADKENWSLVDTPKGEFLHVSFLQKGKDSSEILRDWIINMIPSISLPKKMFWKDRDFGFLRPIRWIVAMMDGEVIELDFHGITSGNISYANRFLGLNKEVVIASAEDYEAALEENFVIPDREKRKAIIREKTDAIFENSVYRIKEDERLLDTVTNLVEYPTPVLGTFDESYLRLPQQVITSTISQNQKYFSVHQDDERLINQFVFVSNGDPEASSVIRAGNEKVVRARLDDALWFFEEDCKLPLESYLPKLKDVVFQAKLGSLDDKRKRIMQLSDIICDKVGADELSRKKALRAAELCKADLVTLMMGENEFAKLQGYIGKQYALESGEDAEVAEAIYEHYMPRGGNDGLPATFAGAVCAVADKLDTVAGIISVGLLPTGSADPFALRRAAGGAVQIIADRSWDIDITELIGDAIAIIGPREGGPTELREYLKNYFIQRVEWLLKESGIAYDVIAAVIHAHIRSIPELIAKARSLQTQKQEDDFVRLVTGYKRVANIIESVKNFEALDENIFEHEAERDLHKALKNLSGRISEALKKLDFQRALKELVSLSPAIDRFFDEVLVNCEDEKLRNNRYALLYAIRREFNRVADLSELVVENESNGV